MLPRPLVRLDTETNSIWVGTHGPLTTGDEVSYQDGGSEPIGPGHDAYGSGCAAPNSLASISARPSDGSY